MEQILLSDFISNALVQIANGVREANTKLKDPAKHQYEVFNLRNIKFDSWDFRRITFIVAKVKNLILVLCRIFKFRICFSNTVRDLNKSIADEVA